MSGGKILFTTSKILLPSYDVFDDTRYFESGDKLLVCKVKGVGNVAVSICEDMWAHFQKYGKNPLAQIKGAKLIVNLSASPFTLEKNQNRKKEAQRHVKKHKRPFVYVNQVGGQDELVFDGTSFILNSKGKVLTEASSFQEQLLIADLSENKNVKSKTQSDDEKLKQALVLGIKDFLKKTNQKTVHLGISGGIDSALVACLAVEALGAENVVGLLLPGPYSSQGSIDDAKSLAEKLKIKTKTIDIKSLYEESRKQLALLKDTKNTMNNSAESLALQNIQARIRGMVLMGYSNLNRSMLLSTSNKSELATGYSTLYGDSCGGLAPIGDLLKTQVYRVAMLYKGIIPQATIEKAPSAELAENQKDQDTLPAYEVLDRAIEKNMINQKPATTDEEKWLSKMMYFSEFKRWQSPPILKISEHAFGRGRRVPIAKYSKQV